MELTEQTHRTTRREAQRSATLFLLAWSLLNICSNLRYPGAETRFSFLLPSLDVAIVLSALALLGSRNIRLSRRVRIVLTTFFLVTRAMRIGDGFRDHYFHRPFNLYFDLRLVPELVRLFYDTSSLTKFVAGALLLAVAVGLLSVSVYWALDYAERYLGAPAHRKVFAGMIAAMIAVSPMVPDTKYFPLWGVFVPSIGERFAQESDFLLHVYGYRKEKLREIENVRQRLRSMPHDLAALGGVNVYLFVVESYGQTVFANEKFQAHSKELYTSFERMLRAGNLDAASAFMTSPTYGGSSWLAQATLATGVRTADQFHYALLLANPPTPIARFFRDAGYRTVSVLPGTRRKWKEGEIFQFEQKYYFADFDYDGPELGWGKLPDQYVIDFVRRRELVHHEHPLFIEYVLVSSHAPWSVVPPFIEDWDSIGRGDVYRRIPPRRFETSFQKLEGASDAYMASIAYDFDVLRTYVNRFGGDDSLFIIVGDHQPVPDVSGDNPPWSVPIHVISRKSKLIERFVAHGYTRGMIPRTPLPHPGLETFLPSLLQDFSSASEPSGKS